MFFKQFFDLILSEMIKAQTSYNLFMLYIVSEFQEWNPSMSTRSSALFTRHIIASVDVYIYISMGSVFLEIKQ